MYTFKNIITKYKTKKRLNTNHIVSSGAWGEVDGSSPMVYLPALNISKLKSCFYRLQEERPCCFQHKFDCPIIVLQAGVQEFEELDQKLDPGFYFVPVL